jgi:hypothetical protein
MINFRDDRSMADRSGIIGLTLYGRAWEGGDVDLVCRYDDPVLAIKWPSETPLVLPRYLELSVASLLRQYEAVAVPTVQA